MNIIKAKVSGSGDSYKRIATGADTYQCGCYWTRVPEFGDVLKQCPIHQQATNSSVAKFERERGSKA